MKIASKDELTEFLIFLYERELEHAYENNHVEGTECNMIRQYFNEAFLEKDAKE